MTPQQERSFLLERGHLGTEANDVNHIGWGEGIICVSVSQAYSEWLGSVISLSSCCMLRSVLL